ncbi:MAG: hybrid sensor histidine kinase/response regulator, partial [Verrucomicrobiota bacterium]|nr:hybrid sensor histidine kinase/response regulator [Verrucomicrobiota bacterium]
MALFRDLPIGSKLRVAILGTSTAALLLAAAAFISYDLLTFRHSFAAELTAQADVIAINSTAALQFQDKADAETTLSALKAVPYTLSASL